jgi:hypothetical protein
VPRILGGAQRLRACEDGRGGTTLRRFEHYDREDPTLDEVILTEEGRVTWKFYAKDDELPMAFEHLTGETILELAVTD